MTPGKIPIIVAACLCLAAATHAQPMGDSCEQAAERAERTHALPPGLLAAIGQIESGRWDPASGRVRAWPWTLNADGVGAFPPDQSAAVSAVAQLQARGTRSIDVGCFQVNLLHHPNAFPTVAEGFVPGVNADYAARFLLSLRERTGGWPEAVAAYHSATPERGGPYWAKVSAAWAGTTPVVPALARVAEATPVPGVHVWTPMQPGTAPAWIKVNAFVMPTVIHLASDSPKNGMP